MEKYLHNELTYYSTHDIAKYIDTYPHKLKEKAERMNLPVVDVPDMPRYHKGIALGDVKALLKSYTTTMSEDKVNKVRGLLRWLTEGLDDERGQKITNIKDVNMQEEEVVVQPEPSTINDKKYWPDPLTWVADFLKSEKALLVFNLALVTVQATFLRDLFESTSTGHWLYSYVFGFAYELTGLTLALNGSTTRVLKSFAIISGLIIALQIGFFDNLILERLTGSVIIEMGKQLILSIALPFMTYSFGARYLSRIDR